MSMSDEEYERVKSVLDEHYTAEMHNHFLLLTYDSYVSGEYVPDYLDYPMQPHFVLGFNLVGYDHFLLSSCDKVWWIKEDGSIVEV